MAGNFSDPISAQPQNPDTNSVLFVAVSFVLLMVICLAWLVFYYIQRFRYAHTKQRISRQFSRAAKKALNKIPLAVVKSGDKELMTESCAICIEAFRYSDVLRVLPCRHAYHRTCVDPWLMDSYNCPMCKLNILHAYGIEVPNYHYLCNPVDSALTVEMVPLDTYYTNSEHSPLSSEIEVQFVHVQPPTIQVHRHEDSTSASSSSRANSRGGSSTQSSLRNVEVLSREGSAVGSPAVVTTRLIEDPPSE